MKSRLAGLYVITDEKLTPKSTMISQVKTALESGAKIVQLRDKSSEDIEILPLAKELQLLCRKYNALFVINDRIKLASQIQSDALHIGKDDITIKEARSIVGDDMIIGVSCYGDLDLAKKMESEGADYVAFGACFSSSTKQTAPTIDLDILLQAKEQLDIPICAIGGINSSNINQISSRGVDMISVVHSVFKDDNIALNVQTLLKGMEQV